MENGKMLNESIIELLSVCDENDKEFKKVDLPRISEDYLGRQLTSADVIRILKTYGLLDKFTKLEKEIEEENTSSVLQIHGIRHFKNVLLYSILIGKTILNDEHDLELVMLSAKYHDIGRKTDDAERHAEASALIAEEKLKGKMSPEDIAAIKTIIGFHEMHRDRPDTDINFYNLAKRNGVPEAKMAHVRVMAEILKDADALDRTRFLSRQRTDPKRLKNDMSKRLIKVAASLRETMALSDLRQLGCEEELNNLLKQFTPQEILRTIRFRTPEDARIEDMQEFMCRWSDSLSNEEPSM